MSLRHSSEAIKNDSNFTESICNVRDSLNVPVETMARIESVLRVLNEYNQKLKISILFPWILIKSDIVYKILENTEYHECAELLKECVKHLRKNIKALKCLESDILITNVIDTFQRNYKIIDIIGHVFQGTHLKDLFYCEAIAASESIYNIAEKRLLKDPRAELLLEKDLDTIYWDSIDLNEYFEKFNEKTLRGKNSLRWRIAAKEAVVANIEGEFVKDKMERQMIFHLEETQAKKKFQEASKICQTKQKDADEDIERAHESLTKTLKQNFITENEVRAEHNKLQIQLQTLVKRYDTVLLEKSKIALQMDQKMKVAQDEFDEFFKFYTEKETIYNDIVTAHELKKQREFEEKLALFVGNRAAKIIQKAWKHYIKIVRKEKAAEAQAGKGKKK